MHALKKTVMPIQEILDPEQINVVRIINPFDPRDHVRETLAWGRKKSLADYFPMAMASQVISLNGAIISPELYASTYLNPGDSLVVCPVPEGGGEDGKGILGMIAMIAVSVFAPQLALAMGATQGTIGFAMAVAGITVAGSLLVQTIFAPSKPSGGGSSDSQTYGIDGSKLTAVEGIPVPVNYGRFRMSGNVIALHVENVDDNQVLYMLINAGEGAISSIDDILINDNPIGDYKNVEAQIRLGTNNQSVIPWFNDTIVPVNKNVKLTTDWSTHTTQGEVDRMRVDVVFPQGLFKVNAKKGSTEEHIVNLAIEYRKVGDTGWTPMKLDNVVVGHRDVHIVLDTTPGWTDQEGYFWRTNPTTGHQERYTPVHRWVYSDTLEDVSDADLAYIAENMGNLHYEQGTDGGEAPGPGDDGTGPAGDGNGSVGGGTAG